MVSLECRASTSHRQSACLTGVPAKPGLGGSLVPDLLRLGEICSPEACGLPDESAVKDFRVFCELREDSLPTFEKKEKKIACPMERKCKQQE